MELQIKGNETPEQLHLMACELANELTKGFYHPNAAMRTQGFQLARMTAIYVLGNVIFQLSMNRADGNLKQVQAAAMIEMDDAKEDLFEQVDFFIAKVKNGEWTKIARLEQPTAPESDAHADHSPNHKEPEIDHKTPHQPEPKS